MAGAVVFLLGGGNAKAASDWRAGADGGVAVRGGHNVSAHALPPDVVRVPEVGPADGSVAAIVASSRSRLVGRRYTVIDASGRLVLAGRLVAVAGNVVPWRFAARADLSRLRRPGTFRVVVGKTRSRTLRIDPQFRAHLLARLLRVYGVNADGAEPNPVFGPSHLHDATVFDGAHAGEHVDLVGGWRDGGDNLKFTLSVAMSVESLAVAARLDPPNSSAYKGPMGIGVRWLLKAHPVPDLFIAQVGDEQDHLTPGAFRRPEGDDGLTSFPSIADRPAFSATGSGTAGAAAAGLASAAQATGDPALRAQLVQAARGWYAYGKTLGAPGPALGRVADPSTGQLTPGFEQPADWTGYMALAADELTHVTGDAAFAIDAAQYLQAATTCFDCGVDLGAIGPLAAGDLCGRFGRPPIADPVVKQVACAKVDIATGDARTRAQSISIFGTPQDFTFGWVQGNGGQGTLLAQTGASADRRLASGARDYLLGRNPWGISFVIGPGPGRAHNPHNPAYLIGPAPTVDDGLVVGGPTSPEALKDVGLPPAGGPLARFNTPTSVYEDRRLDYETSEVGLSYSDLTILLLAATG